MSVTVASDSIVARFRRSEEARPLVERPQVFGLHQPSFAQLIHWEKVLVRQPLCVDLLYPA